MFCGNVNVYFICLGTLTQKAKVKTGLIFKGKMSQRVFAKDVQVFLDMFEDNTPTKHTNAAKTKTNSQASLEAHF